MAKHAVVKKTGLIEQAYATITPLKLADPVARKLRHHLVLEVENVVHQDPKLELKRLVGCHKRWTEQARIMGQMVGDREIRATGEIIKCDKDTAIAQANGGLPTVAVWPNPVTFLLAVAIIGLGKLAARLRGIQKPAGAETVAA